MIKARLRPKRRIGGGRAPIWRPICSRARSFEYCFDFERTGHMNESANHSSESVPSLNRLSSLARSGDADARERAQARLEGQLQPIVRLALRKGVGIPRVVGWVRQAHARLAGGVRSTDPDQYTAEITRMLTATLLDRPPRRSTTRDTVFGI